MNSLKILIIFLLLASTSGCAAYLYSAYIPATAYNVVQAIENNNQKAGPAKAEILVASADSQKSVTGSAGNADPAGAVDPATGTNGRILDNMRTATIRFQDLLQKKQVKNAKDYVLTRLDNSDNGDFVMIASVYRPEQMIEVKSEKVPGTTRIITDKSPAYYEPYRLDTDGRPLDRVVAWSLVPTECIQDFHQQAVILNDTADMVSSKTIEADFWAARNQWENGNVGQLLLAGHLMSCPARFSS